MLLTMNNSSVSQSPYNGYTFGNGLAKSAGRIGRESMTNTTKKPKEGFLSGASYNSNAPEWRIEDYLDDSRGPDCAGKSFGITASGGPLCLTPEQTRAMTTRGFNTDDSGCAKNFYK